MDYTISYFNYTDPEEVAAVYAIEQQCFPPNEAESQEQLLARAKACPDCFWVIRDNISQAIVGFLNGLAVKQQNLTEEVFHDASLGHPDNPWVMLISLDIAPAYQNKGLSKRFIQHVLQELNNRKKYKGYVFICKEKLVSYYSTFGFVDEGISECHYGGETWHQMRMLAK